MKQIVQNLRSGQISLADVPCPALRPGHLLIQSICSLISPGTERSLIEFGEASLIGKARAKPERIRQVLEKIKTDGLLPTLEVVFNRLDEPLPLGYCNVGRVVDVGAGVEGFEIDDRVVSNGPHAEMIVVPSTLAARIPNEVEDESASFAVLGSIALQGIRLAEPTFGESFAVVGLGLVGQLAAQLLQAHGCRVLGIDTNVQRCQLAAQFGCEQVVAKDASAAVRHALNMSRNHGVDGVIIAASSKNDDIVHQAAMMCRKRGRIVLVGVVDLSLSRSDFYEKELTFQVSCSYGPGRYDRTYENRALDYPYSFVRWTAGRNFEAILQSIARKQLDITNLLTDRVDHANAAGAYETLLKDNKTLGVLLQYPKQIAPADRVVFRKTLSLSKLPPSLPVVGVVGAGQFAKSVLLPALRDAGATIRSVASFGGVSAAHIATKFDIRNVTTDWQQLLEDDEIEAVFLVTPHNLHSEQVSEALQAGKHVFVEKPLAIDEDGLHKVCQAHLNHSDKHLMVGFNRRFAPHTIKAKQLLETRSDPIAVVITINAGYIPADHWHHDPKIGGGRIIGEGCHFIDLMLFLVGSPIRSVQATAFRGTAPPCDDKAVISFSFEDGSIGTLHYLANGTKAYPKERIEIFSEQRVLVIENWRRMRGFHWPGAPTMKMRQDKGHRAEITSFVSRLRQGGEALIPFDDLEMVTRASIAAVQSMRQGQTISLTQMINNAPHVVRHDAVLP